MDPNKRGHWLNRSRSKQSAISKHPTTVVPLPKSENNFRLGKTTSNKSVITFSRYENVELDMTHDDALIITIELARVAFSKVLIDSGCVNNLLSHETLERIDPSDVVIDKYAPPLFSFGGGGGGSRVPLLGKIVITVKIYDLEQETEFSVMNDLSPFDAVL